jgi:hypothetical protein
MAIVSVTEVCQGRAGERTFQRGPTDIRVFEVITDTLGYTSDTIIEGSLTGSSPGPDDCPDAFDAHPDNPWMILMGLAASNAENDPYLWEIRVSYSQPEYEDLLPTTESQGGSGANTPGAGGGAPSSDPPDPADSPMGVLASKFSVSADNREVPILDAPDVVGGDPVPVLNTAKDPFDPPAVKDLPIIVMRLTYYQSALSIASLIGHRRKVNSVKFAVYGIQCPVRTLILWDFTAEREKIGGQRYWKIEVTFKQRDDGWDFRPVDRGFNYINDDLEKVPIFNEKTGQPITKPAFLNGVDGGLLPDGDPPVALFFATRDSTDLTTYFLGLRFDEAD